MHLFFLLYHSLKIVRPVTYVQEYADFMTDEVGLTPLTKVATYICLPLMILVQFKPNLFFIPV